MIEGLLFDIDGVLVTGWEPIPGAVETLAGLRAAGVPFRLLTNTTTKTRADLGGTLRAGGFDVRDEDVITAVVATAGYLRTQHPGAGVFVLSDGDASSDLESVRLVEVDEADVVVLGGAGPDFAYPILNRIFRRLMEGAALVGMHRNLYWRTAEGWELDGGAYIAGLEEAAGVTATICGKPAPAYFGSALGSLGVSAERVAMVGDDIVNDVLGAQASGIVGVLVRTGKFQGSDLERGRPDHVIASVADVPSLIGEA
jgi:HAD superfamily hydrolase (TIGR01458 family)